MKIHLLGKASLAALLVMLSTAAAFAESPEAGASAPFELLPRSTLPAASMQPHTSSPPSIFHKLRKTFGRSRTPDAQAPPAETPLAEVPSMSPDFDAGAPAASAVDGFAMYPVPPVVLPDSPPHVAKAPPAVARLPRARPIPIAAVVSDDRAADWDRTAPQRKSELPLVGAAFSSDPQTTEAPATRVEPAEASYALTPVDAIPQAAPPVPPPSPEAAASLSPGREEQAPSVGELTPASDFAPAPATVASATLPPEASTSAPVGPVEPVSADLDEEASPPTQAAALPAPANTSPPRSAIIPVADQDGADTQPSADGKLIAGETPATPDASQRLPVDSAIISAADRELPPYRLVQSLQNLQDQIAHGSTEAFAAQRSMLDRIDAIFAAEPAAAWQQPGNAAALVTYVLSGGTPTVLQHLMQSSQQPALDEGLMRGALAYVEGRPDKALEFLANIDARSFPASMGSQLAIAQAALVVAKDAKRAAELLDLARLLSPGTLAEEAALRREIVVVAQLQDVDKFQSLSRQYFQRFRNSPYAGNFRERFAAALTRMSFLDDPAQLPRLDLILAELQPDARRELFLIVARAAAVQGKTNVGQFAAGRALATAGAGSANEARALLYRAAVSVVDPKKVDATLADLKRTNGNLLAASDKQLLAVVASTAEIIRTASVPNLPPKNIDPAAADSEADSIAIRRAQDAIKVADNLLNGKPL